MLGVLPAPPSDHWDVLSSRKWMKKRKKKKICCNTFREMCGTVCTVSWCDSSNVLVLVSLCIIYSRSLCLRPMSHTPTFLKTFKYVACDHAHLCDSFEFWARLPRCDFEACIKVTRKTPAHKGSSIESPSGPRKSLFLTQSAIKGDILEEGNQTASNEFLTTILASGEDDESGGKQRRRETPAECITMICGLTFEREWAAPCLRSSGCCGCSVGEPLGATSRAKWCLKCFNQILSLH